MKRHSEHGLGDDSGPFDPDCPCRGTNEQAACAAEGCGFCRAAEMRREDNTRSLLGLSPRQEEG